MRSIELRFHVPFEASAIRVACAALTTMNRLYLRMARAAGVAVPNLYDAGVRYYHPRGPEQWDTIPDVLRKGTGDCKCLAAWRAAELLESGQKAFAVPVQQHADLFHVIVRYHDGKIEDPSKLLGMGQRDLQPWA